MRNANRFYRGEPLTAARLNDLVEAANRFSSGANASGDFGRRPVRSATVKNESGAVVPRFGVLEVSGFWRPAATRDEAVERFAASGIELTGTTPTGSADAFLVVATEPIPPGEFGPVAAATGSAFLAEVVGANDAASFGFATPATDAANAGKLVASGNGPFRIVARSASGVCLLTPKSKEETKVPEIFFATVAEPWTQNGSRNAEISIAYYDRTAGATVSDVALSPLSRENDLLAAGTQILVVKTVDGAVYLLNAECPQ